MSVVLPILLSTIVAVITLVYASYRDLKERYVPPRTWYPALALGIPMVVFYYTNLGLSNGWLTVIAYITLSTAFSVAMFLLASKHMLGGADAKALILMAVCIPVFPLSTYFESTALGFLPFAVLSNAVTFGCTVPLVIFLLNVIKGRKAPIHCMFFGFPVDGDKIQNTFGYVMEDIGEREGILTRRFLGIGETWRMTGIYTKKLRLNPELYKRELELYRKAGTVWVSYGIPFIVFITAGLLCAVIFGDPVFAFMEMLM